MLINQLLQFIYYLTVIFEFSCIAVGASWHTHCFTRLTLTHSMNLDHELSQYAFLIKR